MKKLLLFTLMLWLTLPAEAQKHDYHWINQIDFNGNLFDFSGNDLVITSCDLNIKTYASKSCMSDAEGNLIFYTNGIDIMNADYELMENGDFIISGADAESWQPYGSPLFTDPLILPLPESDDLYYLFYRKLVYVSYSVTTPELYYAVVDMSKNSGKGAVLEKEQVVAVNSHDTYVVGFDTPTAVRHANGRDWWVLAPYHHEAKALRFLLTPQGIEDTATIAMADYVKPPYPEFMDAYGENIFSPDGTIFVDSDESNDVRVFDFDRCEGILSNYRSVYNTPYKDTTISSSGDTLVGATEKKLSCMISPNSRFLYLMDTDSIFQYDLQAGDIDATQTLVALLDTSIVDNLGYPYYFAWGELTPDGRIFIIGTVNGNRITYINRPNLQGTACEVNQWAIEAPNRIDIQFPHYPNYRLGPIDGSPCDTLGIDNLPVAKYRYDQDTTDYLKVYFTDLSYYEPADWYWDFDDGSSSTDTCPVHIFPASGIYEVCLRVSNANLPQGDTFCQTLYLGVSSTDTEEASGYHSHLYPNPFKEQTTLFIYDYLPQDAYTTWRDALGREVFRQRVYAGDNALKVGDLPSGVYFYSIEEQGEVLESGRVVKE